MRDGEVGGGGVGPEGKKGGQSRSWRKDLGGRNRGTEEQRLAGEGQEEPREAGKWQKWQGGRHKQGASCLTSPPLPASLQKWQGEMN